MCFTFEAYPSRVARDKNPASEPAHFGRVPLERWKKWLVSTWYSYKWYNIDRVFSGVAIL
jgi:hypothetical protein